jgi:hypothetical protein
MNRLEELQRDLSVARRNWKWAEVRRLEAAIAAEEQVLAKTADELPAVEGAAPPKKKPSKKRRK